MANTTGTSKDVIFLGLFGVLAIGLLMFVVSTDVFTLFSVTGLTLDATNSRGSPNERGVDASTGQFKGEGNILENIDKFQDKLEKFLDKLENKRLKFKEPKAPKEPKCKKGKCSEVPPVLPPTPPVIPTTPRPTDPPIITLPPIPEPTDRPTPPPAENEPPIVDVEPLPQVVTVIDLRDGTTTNVILIDGVKGGGVEGSSTTEKGIPELIRNEVIIHERFHTPANGQTTTGSLLLEWGHGGSITVQQFLVPNEFYDWFEVKLPQTLRGDGAITFDGVSEGEFIYKLTIPDDLIDRNTVIPVRLIINTQNAVVDGVSEIQIDRPVSRGSDTFSVAEFFRSLFTEIRSSFA